MEIESFPDKADSMTIHFIIFFKPMPHRSKLMGIPHIGGKSLVVSNHHPIQLIASF